MTDRKPEGTFSRLMSTPRAPEQVVEEQPKATPAAEEASDECVQARTHAPKRPRTDAPSTNTNSRGAKVNVDALYRQLQAKQHLASSTFRFRPEELDELDQVFVAISTTKRRKVSKNDLVRLGLNWLLEDYHRHGDESVLAQVLARV